MSEETLIIIEAEEGDLVELSKPGQTYVNGGGGKFKLIRVDDD